MKPARHHWVAAVALAILLGLPLTAHLIIGWVARPEPPSVQAPAGTVERHSDRLRTFGLSHVLRRGKLLEVRLVGQPEHIGYVHARLLRDEMLQIEAELHQSFRQQISWAIARLVLLDLAQYRYRNVDEQVSAERKRELAGLALGLEPDPYLSFFPTYQRFIYLNALYDIGLSFEHSPLVGCTTFILSGNTVPDGGALLARAFDFEVSDIFDERKAVFLVRETGRIPFASVAWPGLVGVFSGMNAEGVALVVHGARAGQPSASGEPVAHALRRVLSTARNTNEAVSALQQRAAMVSHIVVITDAQGRSAAVERLSGKAAHTRWLGPRAVVTNHFEGPAAEDPKNVRVRESTSTSARQQRGAELLGKLEPPLLVRDAVRLLRDRRAAGGQELELGDRRAIDALIATHGVVMDTAERTLWVSESPHLLGRFVAFELKQLLAESYDPIRAPLRLDSVPEDPLLTSGQYARWQQQPASGRR